MASIGIIGGGVSGLSAGIYALMNGHKATIYEKHSRAGGNLTGWNRQGYHIDNCIHWLTGTNPRTNLYKIWHELGALGDVEIYQAETLYSFEKNNQRISLSKDINKLKKDMLQISPKDKKEILSFIHAIKSMQKISGIANFSSNEKNGMLNKIKNFPSLIKYHGMTTGELADRFHHPLLKGFIESFMSRRFSALALVMVFSTFCGENGGIPKGSSCAMADRMTERFISLGGKLILNNGVTKINIQDEVAQSITLEEGSIIKHDYIIATSDPSVIFGKLLDNKFMPVSLKKLYRNPKMYRFSSYHCAFSCETANLPFKGDMIFEIPKKYSDILNSKYLILREFSHEKSFSPDGKNIIQSIIFCAEKEARKYISLTNNRKMYNERKRKMSDTILKIIESEYPMLEGKIKCIDSWTPATYHRYVGSEIGSYMSFAFSSKVMIHRLSSNIKGLKNVLLASQWLQAPGGLPIAARCGKEAINEILRMEKRKVMST